jgi:D-alanyl-lipoteichoic acid acyltransferase DltB (MBOAT superfamily)
MLFQTQFYILIFLPLAVAAFYLAAGRRALRQWILVVASLVFYGWWDVRFVPLVLGQITATWLLALMHQGTGRRGWLVAGVVLNLASIGTFKYLDFFLTSLAAVAGHELAASGIILPIGISFFSFQLISYLVDRMRGDAPIYPWRPFALFVLLFPHLIAGPIVRHNELIPQFDEDPRRDGRWMRISAGLMIFTVGFAKKVLLADPLAAVSDPLFAKVATQALSFGEAWTAALAFSLQLFLDFSAYTEMAIGSALLFGLLLPENFRRPYLAVSLQDFWRRWHISLSLFIRDYLYVPLGGSRGGWRRYVFATMASMAICGLWHGAGWTYVVWGLWHGAGLVVYRGWKTLQHPLPSALGWLLTMAFVGVGWVIFRSTSFSEAASVLGSLAGAQGVSGSLMSIKLIVAAAIASVVIPSAHQIKDQLLKPDPLYAIGAAALAVFCVLEVGRGAPVSFIYFQF